MHRGAIEAETQVLGEEGGSDHKGLSPLTRSLEWIL